MILSKKSNFLQKTLLAGFFFFHATLLMAATAPQKLLVLGDSLSAAYGMKVTQGWVSLLQDEILEHELNIKVINASISGETTSGGKARLAKLLKQHSPQWMIVELGANDALRGQNLKVTRNNLQAIIDLGKTQNIKTFLLGIRLPTNYGPAYDLMLQKVYKSLADKNQLLFDPFFLEDVALDPDLMQFDALHPNAAAQPVILKRLWPKVEQLLQE